MLLIKLDANRITDWESFFAVFAELFGFPDFFGRNLNAWVDCMTYLDDPSAGMTSVHVDRRNIVVLHIEHMDTFAQRCPEQYEALVECAAFVNWRRIEAGHLAVLTLSFYKQAD